MIFWRRLWCKLTRFQCILLTAILVNLLVYFYLAHRQRILGGATNSDMAGSPTSVTVLIREFEDFENEISDTIKSIQTVLPSIKIVIVSDEIPYPPLNVPDKLIGNVHLVTLKVSPDKSKQAASPESLIGSKYILIIPDAVAATPAMNLQRMIEFLESRTPDVKMAVWAGSDRAQVDCWTTTVELREWTIKHLTSDGLCDSVNGCFVLLIRKEDFLSLPYPYARPFDKAFFIQTALRGWKIAIHRDTPFQILKNLHEDAHNHWKYKSRQQSRLKHIYSDFGIKLVKHTDGREEWYGCNKETARCFGTVINDMPDYLFRQRWTPPCCLNGLRVTGRHVFRVLESHGIRYWLEGGSLLGAVRQADIVPWDFDIDIGIYKDDMSKLDYFEKCHNKPYEDDDGFVWEKAREGDFYRVQYSNINRLHVDIFPFYEKNGVMTKSTWFKTHRQDTEFPVHYLKPLTKLQFLGVEASVPNHWREFLELKFGKGVIENPKYPDTSNVKL